eukprot:GHVT01105089.1.p1 GENE.GHVT01105089.1~~GHVT01105089.1.p1  ORF type:complete len:135 (-),score=0.96 GHVT01105089.1:1216-1620(-)
MLCHEHAGSACRCGAVLAQTGDLVISVDLVEFQDCKLYWFFLVLSLLRLRVSLLFALLATTEELDRLEHGRFLKRNRTVTHLTINPLDAHWQLPFTLRRQLNENSSQGTLTGGGMNQMRHVKLRHDVGGIRFRH